MSVLFIIMTFPYYYDIPVVNPGAQGSTNLLILVFTFKCVNIEDKKCINILAFFPQIQNLPIEQFWIQANTRVNYPIKAPLVDFDNSSFFGIDNMVHCYCVSWVTCKVTSFRLQTYIAAWNEHQSLVKGFIFMVSDNHILKECQILSPNVIEVEA